MYVGGEGGGGGGGPARRQKFSQNVRLNAAPYDNPLSRTGAPAGGGGMYVGR